jgi:hypothetical protein
LTAQEDAMRTLRRLHIKGGLAVATFSLATGALAADGAAAADAGHPRVRIQNVEVRLSPVGPVVLLKAGNKAIPVFVNQDLLDSQGLDLDQPESKPETKT